MLIVCFIMAHVKELLTDSTVFILDTNEEVEHSLVMGDMVH